MFNRKGKEMKTNQQKKKEIAYPRTFFPFPNQSYLPDGRIISTVTQLEL